MDHRAVAPLYLVITAAMAMGLTLAVAPAAAAATPALSRAAAQGKYLFNHDKFGGVRTCSACHINNGTTLGRLPNGAKIPSLIGVAAQFPRRNPATHQRITLEQQLVHCITGGLQGKAPAAHSAPMTDLIAYLNSLSKAAAMGSQAK